MTPNGVALTCVDLRPPYQTVAWDLGLLLKPDAGNRSFQPNSGLIDFWVPNYDERPLFTLPHDTGCVAWENDGGDEAGVAHSVGLADFASWAGLPSFCAEMRDGKPPLIHFDGLLRTPWSFLSYRFRKLIDNPNVNWHFRKPKPIPAFVVGHEFYNMAYRALRWTSYAVREQSVETIRRVLNHFRGNKTPQLYFSDEISHRRRQGIIELVLEHQLPVALPV